MNVSSTQKQIGQLFDFLQLLQKWNRTYNLTSIEKPYEMVTLHLLDSISILPYLKGVRVLDVGTGAGLPGLPLAILCTDKEFTLLDSNSKKVRFVKQVTIELGLSNVNVEHSRIERFESKLGFDTILTRAFASLSEIVSKTTRLLNPEGVILAQKGKLPEKEISQLNNNIIEVFPMEIPGIGAERHLIAIEVRS